MNNLVQNYKIILKELTKTCAHIEPTRAIRVPKLSDLELVALNITAEYVSIDSELQLFKCLYQTELDTRIERSVYNRRRRLAGYIEKIRLVLSGKFADLTDVFIVDSTPVEICRISRANRSGICRTEEAAPDFGYCAAQKTKYFGYKLHAVCDKNGVFHSFDLSPASVHDVNYLKDVRHNLKDCLLLGDRDISARKSGLIYLHTPT